jgi:hypothetical protein
MTMSLAFDRTLAFFAGIALALAAYGFMGGP